jgi:hypothetical protein
MVEVLGTFRVNKINFWSANVQYMVLFLRDRLVFVKVGGQFADQAISSGAIVGGALGGIVGGIIGAKIGEKLDKTKGEKKVLETAANINRFSEMSVDELVRLDKANYELPYNNISKIEIQQSSMGANGPRTGTLSIQGAKKEKFDIAPNQDYNFCAETIKTLLADKSFN